MFTNAFVGQPHPPTDAQLTTALGPAKAVWDQLLADLAEHSNLTTREWNSYSRKAGWSLRLKHAGRNIIYLAPGRGSFLASFAFSDKAVQASRTCRLPKAITESIAQAPRYPEGTAVRIEVTRPAALPTLRKLTNLKLAH